MMLSEVTGVTLGREQESPSTGYLQILHKQRKTHGWDLEIFLLLYPPA